MKSFILILCTIIVFSFAILGCKGKTGQTSKTGTTADSEAALDDQAEGYQPSQRRVLSEFQSVWNEAHGDKADIENQWRLVGTEVGSIRPDKKAKTATVNIRFTYVRGNKAQKTKSADFLFHEVAGSWTIDSETAQYPIK